MPYRAATNLHANDAAPTWREQAGARRRRRVGMVATAVRRLVAGSIAVGLSVGAGVAAGVADWSDLVARAGGVAWPAGQTAILAATLAATGTMAITSMLLAAGRERRRLAPLRRLAKSAVRVQAGGDVIANAEDWFDGGGDEVAAVRAAIARLAAQVATHRRELAERDARSAASIRELEAKLADRASQLTLANERLVEEIAEKEDFVRAISHDLNAPLRNIGGMVTMLLTKHRATFADDVVHKLERVKANVDHEAGLIDELLEFSRIKTRRQSLQVVEVEKLVWELRGLFENDLKTKSIDLVLETSLPNLFAERVRVRQVFQNLIDNAIKYMGDGPRPHAIYVGCRMGVSEAEFYVRDTGIGIDPADVDKVFHIFRRGKSEQAQRVAGKGVGLASVKSIIETYAGRIWVESELGRGTTFRFTINGQFVPAVSGQVPQEMAGQATHVAPTLARGGAVADPRAA